MVEVKPLGDRALLLTFGQRIDPEINHNICAYHSAIKEKLGHKVTFLIPAYTTIAVGFDPLTTDRKLFMAEIEGLKINDVAIPRRHLKIPVCYDTDFALDAIEVQRQTGLDHDEIIQIHTRHEFLVYMLGFVPGFVYMGSLPRALRLGRRSSPRRAVPPGSVALAGEQTGIYPSATPGGWQIIGRTPIPMLSNDEDAPSPFAVGDRVSFQAIDKEKFRSIEELVELGTFGIIDLVLSE